ncbi:MAG: 23S rRNA (adenine(2503)-C(2))-methyltransferase RlmN, partial [Chloroflexota bacterium]
MTKTITTGLNAVTDLTPAGVEEMVQSLGGPRYRAKQIIFGLYRRLAASFDEMTDLPKEFRKRLMEVTRCRSLTPVQEVTGGDGTVKTVFTLADGKTIESTLMSYPTSRARTRHTVCVSTQVGCPIGCPFCATGQQGFERNLTPGEIIDQVLSFARRLREQDGGPVTNVVFMGMGEPLANFDALWQAIEMLNSPAAFGLGARNMVVSTAGLVPGIERLGRQKLQVGLAVSLHAADNALRDRLVPLNRKYPLEQLIPACREYIARTGRRISFEYALFAGVNDGVMRAR